jgi:hypothetical protein
MDRGGHTGKPAPVQNADAAKMARHTGLCQAGLASRRADRHLKPTNREGMLS